MHDQSAYYTAESTHSTTSPTIRTRTKIPPQFLGPNGSQPPTFISNTSTHALPLLITLSLLLLLLLLKLKAPNPNFNMLSSQIMERNWKSHVEVAPHCPRCASSNTKFCYYNNYSLSQPRYFCKGCRRYWTKGGSLRNVPVGGGCRKSRRAKSARVDRSNSRPNYCLNSNLGQESASNDNNGPDIDLAVVFAKFLNQEPSFQGESSEDLTSVANSLTPDSDTAVECRNFPAADLVIQDSGLLEQVPYHHQAQEQQENQERFQELAVQNDQEMNEFGLESLLGDEMVQDALWSEATTTLANDITWQPSCGLIQPQEFDSLITVDDQLKIPTNLMTDNVWSSFDLSGFEVFSGP